LLAIDGLDCPVPAGESFLEFELDDGDEVVSGSF
jgi:hypothetical protein